MSLDDALNLSEIDPAHWRVLVKGEVYGPYTLGQMQRFIKEQRIGPGTQAADGNGGAFLPAQKHTSLAAAFRAEMEASSTDDVPAYNYLIIAKLTGTG